MGFKELKDWALGDASPAWGKVSKAMMVLTLTGSFTVLLLSMYSGYTGNAVANITEKTYLTIGSWALVLVLAAGFMFMKIRKE